MRLFNKVHYIFILVFVVFFSCKKSSTLELKFEGEYYADVDPIKTLSSLQIQGFFKLLGSTGGYPQASQFASEVKSDVEVKKVKFQTTLGGDKIVASGLLSHPAEEGSYPLLCFHNGTNVLHDNAPSVNHNDQLFLLLESIASLGFVVVIPDYPGFGSSNYLPHPYLIKEETVQSSKDILLATNEYLQKKVDGVTLSNDLYLMGYSQGAWATLQLQREIELNGLGSFDLVASSCGGGPYSISSLFLRPFSDPEFSVISNPYFFAYMMNAYSEYGLIDTLKLSDIFNEEYALKISGLFNGRNSSSAINDSLSTSVDELINAEYRTGVANTENASYAPVREAFKLNDVQAWQLVTPTKLFHGTADEVVPDLITTEMVENLKMAGSGDHNIEEIALYPLGHTEAVYPYGLATFQWFLELKNQP